MYLGECGLVGSISMFPFLVEMEVLHLLGVAPFFVPVAHESPRTVLAVEVGGLLHDEVLVHA